MTYTAPDLRQRTEIALIADRWNKAYQVAIGWDGNDASVVEIVHLKQADVRPIPAFGARFPTRLLREFAEAFTAAADLIDSRKVDGGGR